MKYFRSLGIAVFAIWSAGCTSIQSERMYPVAELFIQFEEGESSFNNRFVLSEQMNEALSFYDNKPVVVVVAAGNDESDFTLAVSRLYSILGSVDVDANFRVLVKPLERVEQRNRVAIYHSDEWSSFEKQYMHDGEYSWVDGSGGIFRSSDERLFMAVPTKKKITPSGSTSIERLTSLLDALGWSVLLVGGADDDETSSRVALGSIELVTLESEATSAEVELLLKGVMGDFFHDYKYEVMADGKLVKVWKSI